jgi:membrane fusion protein (multidrug efflux system)
MWVDFRLPERYVGRTAVGQPVQVTLDALPGQTLSGKVEALDALVDANGRSLLVRARIEQRDGPLKSGMFARARVVFAVRERALLVPEEALVPQGGKQYLFKAVAAASGAASAAANGTPPALVSQRVEAQLGVRLAGKVEILQGLAPEDLVVTAGHARLARGDGVPLRVIDLDKPAGRPAGGASAPGGAGSAPRTGAPA